MGESMQTERMCVVHKNLRCQLPRSDCREIGFAPKYSLLGKWLWSLQHPCLCNGHGTSIWHAKFGKHTIYQSEQWIRERWRYVSISHSNCLDILNHHTFQAKK